MSMSTKPLFGSLGFPAKTLDSQPKFGRVIRHGEMYSFVRHQVPQHELGSQNEFPVER